MVREPKSKHEYLLNFHSVKVTSNSFYICIGPLSKNPVKYLQSLRHTSDSSSIKKMFQILSVQIIKNLRQQVRNK